MTQIIALCIVGVIFQSVFIGYERRKKYTRATCLKGMASLVFVIIGFLCIEGSVDQHFAKLVATGLILGAVGDVLLELRFVLEKIGSKVFLVGVTSFLAGHILYVIALADQATDILLGLGAGVVLGIVIIVAVFSILKDIKPAFKIFGVVYLGAVSVMAAVAVVNFFTLPASAGVTMFAVGAVAFLVSDVVMILNSFGPKERFSLRITNLGLYYLGQLLIAISLMFV